MAWCSAGPVARLFLKISTAIQSSGLRLVAVADIEKSVLCHKYAGELGIKVFDDYQDLLTMEGLDLILECTGDERILSEIIG